MAFFAPIAGIASSIIGAAGTLYSGITAYQSGKYQQAVAEQNARVAQMNATRAKERAAIEAEDNDTLTLQMLGAQEAAQSSSGVSLQGGSPGLVRKAARRLGRRDTLNIINAGDIEAWNYNVDAMGHRAAGQAAKMEGKASLIGSFLGAGGSLIGGAASVRDPNRYTASSAYDPWRSKAGTNMRRRTI